MPWGPAINESLRQINADPGIPPWLKLTTNIVVAVLALGFIALVSIDLLRKS